MLTCFVSWLGGGHRKAIDGCLAVVMMFASLSVLAQTTDVFGRTSTGTPSAANTADAARPALGAMPSIIRDAVNASIHLQSTLNEQLQETLANERDGSDLFTTGMIVLCSFAYGVLHALGPGHGKIVVSAYLASHRARFVDAALLSGWSALVQSMSAIVLVGGVAWLSREGLRGVLTRASSLELASYIVLLCVGAWTLWSVVTRRDCCDVDRLELVPKKHVSLVQAGSDEKDQARYLGASLVAQRRSRARWTRTDAERGPSRVRKEILMTGVAVGVRPCVGAIFVLTAALANKVFIVGVLASLAMGAGVACTVLAIGMTSLSMNRMVSKAVVFRHQKIERVRFGLALAGALFITAFAAWQVFALVSGTQAASLA
ncbi:hypothetical protein M0D69_40040 [Caballeronia sp. SEWSISQ10-4 2]|uniref:nickel/cobalt transporter n=1 Tax=Caballeronia sp. SEWSISQ10-4 2 TaxID=2937438 RepID=UPI002655D928|nr:hypothetical protein [Caballeronia sp. SEWSISQ10-4 2]MDN7184100.1 hypothetical protein [Caballeronia sp. SEWSISQ10-4 2]